MHIVVLGCALFDRALFVGVFYGWIYEVSLNRGMFFVYAEIPMDDNSSVSLCFEFVRSFK